MWGHGDWCVNGAEWERTGVPRPEIRGEVGWGWGPVGALDVGEELLTGHSNAVENGMGPCCRLDPRRGGVLYPSLRGGFFQRTKCERTMFESGNIAFVG